MTIWFEIPWTQQSLEEFDWKFLAYSKDDYRRLISAAKWVRPRPRQELLEQISELYRLVEQTQKLRGQGP
jgi:hypothetical protein